MDKGSSTERLAQVLREELGRCAPGDRLPSTRVLVERHQASPVTVSRALAALAAEGLVVTRPGAGTFVARPARRPVEVDDAWQTAVLAERTVAAGGFSSVVEPPDEDGVVSLAVGYPHSSLLATGALAAALARAARLPDAWDRPPVEGLRSLRAWWARASGAAVEPGEVLVTSGGQGALSAALRALVPAGRPLLVESPTYPGALAVARSAGMRTVPVPVDAGGLIPDLLADAFARTGAQAVYCQPTYHNPTGAVMPPERRAAVLGVAAAAGAFVVEDDYARWLAHGPPPPPPLLATDDAHRVIWVSSLTKTASPSLRVGAIIARGPVLERLRASRVVDDMFVSRPLQAATVDLVCRPAWDRHLRNLTTVLERRSRLLAGALAERLPALSLPARPTGGLHLWTRLPPGGEEGEVARRARARGVIVMPGRPFFPAEPPGGHLRLTLCAADRDDDLLVGVERLAAACPELTVERPSG